MRIVDHDVTIGRLPVSFSNPFAFERKAEKQYRRVEKGCRTLYIGKGGKSVLRGQERNQNMGPKKVFRVKSGHFYTSQSTLCIKFRHFQKDMILSKYRMRYVSWHSKLNERRLPKVSKYFWPLPSHKYVHLSDRQIWAFVDLEIWISLGSGVN